MPSSKLRLKFFEQSLTDYSFDAFTHWVQNEYDLLQAELTTAKSEIRDLRKLCKLLNKTAFSFDKDSEDYKKSCVMWNQLITTKEQ